MGRLAAARGPRRRRPPGSGVGRPILEPGGVGGREDRGVPDVLHEPAVPAERRAQQHRHAGPQAGGHQAPAARHRSVSARPDVEKLPTAPPAAGRGGGGWGVRGCWGLGGVRAGSPPEACQNLGEVSAFASGQEPRPGSVVGTGPSGGWAPWPERVPEGGCGGAVTPACPQGNPAPRRGVLRGRLALRSRTFVSATGLLFGYSLSRRSCFGLMPRSRDALPHATCKNVP